MATLTNIKTAQAQDGQSVIVTLSGEESVQYLSTLQIGQLCSCSPGDMYGEICSIDLYGTSFKVTPIEQYPYNQFSSIPGYLEAGETITTE